MLNRIFTAFFPMYFQFTFIALSVLCSISTPMHLAADNCSNPHPQLTTLMTIYDAMGGPYWRRDEGWKEAKAGTKCDPCDGTWYGIVCQGQQIVSLDLSYNGLRGTIPPEIGRLTNLTFLDLGLNRLYGNLPKEIGNFPFLEVLLIDENRISGSIPKEIGNLSNLRSLFLNENILTGNLPVELGNLSKLKKLDLHYNRIRGNIPSSIGNLPILELLHLWGNELSGCFPANFINFCNPNIQVNCLYNRFLQPGGGDFDQFCANPADECIGNCPSPPHPDFDALIALYNATNGPNWTKNSGWIEGSNGFSCDPCADNWYGVYCQNNRVTELLLGNNQLSGTLPTQITTLSELQVLSLYDNALRGPIPAKIDFLTNLRAVILNKNTLSGSIPSQIGSLPNLTTLNLSKNQLSGSIPATIGNLPSLKGCHLRYNQLSGNIPREVGQLSNLISLNLGHNQLTGGIPPEVGNLSRLETMALDHNQLSGSLPATISQLMNLGSIFCNKNQLSGCFPPSFANLCGQLVLYDFSKNPIFPNTGDFSLYCGNPSAFECEEEEPGGDFTRIQQERLKVATTSTQNSTLATPINKAFQVYGNQPNPFSEQTQLKFWSDQEQSLQLLVYDLSGRKVLHKQAKFNEGLQYWTIDNQELQGRGVFVYELIGEGHKQVGRLVKE